MLSLGSRARGNAVTMNLAGSAGEMLVPFALGAAFERGRYDAFGASLAVLNLIVLSATALAHRVTKEYRLKRRDT